MSFEKVPNSFGNFFNAEITVEEHRVFRFRSFVLDAVERQLCREDEVVPVSPKVFDTLVYLAARAGHLVTKEELMNAIWPDSFVDEGNIPRTIHTLRKTLGEEEGNKFIETVPTKGYRFIAVVEATGKRRKEITLEDGAKEATAETLKAASEPAAKLRTRRIWPRFAYLTLAGLLSVSVLGHLVLNRTPLTTRLAKAAPPHSINGKAYRNVQEGRLMVEVRAPESYKKALENFEEALAIDPTYADAYAGKADAKAFFFNSSGSPDDIESARAAVEKALGLDPNNSYALTIKCRISGTYEWKFDQAVSECGRAVELGPDDNLTHRELGFALNVLGREEEALAEMARAVELSPTSFNKRSWAMIAYMSRRYDEAIRTLEQVESTDPGNTDAQRWLMSCFAMKNDPDRAFEYLVKLQELSDVNSQDLLMIRSSFKSGGWPAAVRATLASASGIGRKKTLIVAALYSQIGENDRALEILNDMHKRRALMMIVMAREPLLDPLRTDPRFAALLSQMNLEMSNGEI